MTQSECGGDPAGATETVGLTTTTDWRTVVDYRGAPFRCSQDVEGFVRRGEGTTDVLIQPEDMHPNSVAKCDCTYDIRFTIEMDRGNKHTFTLHRRKDSLNRDTSPILVQTIMMIAEGEQP